MTKSHSQREKKKKTDNNKNQNKKVSRTENESLCINEIHKCPGARRKALQRVEHMKNQSTRDREGSQPSDARGLG